MSVRKEKYGKWRARWFAQNKSGTEQPIQTGSVLYHLSDCIANHDYRDFP
ncbi:hypothetical protein [Lactobacillus kullabergensis]|nr:hypothetical protein [Lactobacillus kullabergensis]